MMHNSDWWEGYKTALERGRDLAAAEREKDFPDIRNVRDILAADIEQVRGFLTPGGLEGGTPPKHRRDE